MSCFDKLISFALIISIGFTVPVIADVPEMINYQGYLKDSGGNPVEDGIYFIKFKIYGSDAGNDSLWTSGFQSIQTTNGLFTYKLGSFVSFPPDLFTGGAVRYLGITVGTDDETSPRTRIISSAYAIKANVTDTAGYAEDIADNSVTGPKIPPNTITSSHIANGAVEAMDVDNDEIQLRVTADCPPGYYVSGIDADGNPTCVEDQIGEGGDITAVYANDGLIGGGTENDVGLSVGAGTGIIVNPDNIAVDLDKIAGGGLVEENDSLRINTRTGLEIDGDYLELDDYYKFGAAYNDTFVNVSQGSAEIFDIPGVASVSRSNEWALSGDVQAMEWLTINCPGPGFVLAQGTVTFHFISGSSPNGVYIGVSESSTDFPDEFKHLFQVHSTMTFYPAITVQGIFPVSPGYKTFYFLCEEREGQINHLISQFSVIYFPASYGPVHDPTYND